MEPGLYRHREVDYILTVLEHRGYGMIDRHKVLIISGGKVHETYLDPRVWRKIDLVSPQAAGRSTEQCPQLVRRGEGNKSTIPQGESDSMAQEASPRARIEKDT